MVLDSIVLFTVGKQGWLCTHCGSGMAASGDTSHYGSAFYQWSLALFSVHKHRRHKSGLCQLSDAHTDTQEQLFISHYIYILYIQFNTCF